MELKNNSSLPTLGITMGDPSGVGPEIISKALSDPGIYKICRPLVLGDLHAMTDAREDRGEASIHAISEPSRAKAKPGCIDIMGISSLERHFITPGKPTVEGGKATVEFILEAVRLTQRGHLDAMVTCPISKALMHEAGCYFEGHTQLIAQRTGSDDFVMMLAGESLRVSLVTIHCSLKEVPALLNEDKIVKTIIITYTALERDFGIKEPRLAVAGLNPHSGESGLFGLEEEEIIKPAIRKAEGGGFASQGPFPPDTLFFRATSGEFDAVVCMYHDQGLIPLKLLHFSDAVNVTLGLPIIRTSVDHGTAYDIAGRGIADASSLKAAIRMAVLMVKNRRKSNPRRPDG
jgi:4-hydroxythreonine-4-phosphate dehydrogenase